MQRFCHWLLRCGTGLIHHRFTSVEMAAKGTFFARLRTAFIRIFNRSIRYLFIIEGSIGVSTFKLSDENSQMTLLIGLNVYWYQLS